MGRLSWPAAPSTWQILIYALLVTIATLLLYAMRAMGLIS
jgi:hypothetical protein